MSLTGQPHDTTNCQMCHLPGTEAVFPIGKNMVKNPQSWLDPSPATTAACGACHVTKSDMAHMVSQTDPKFGESCDVCHAAGAAYDVDHGARRQVGLFRFGGKGRASALPFL